MRASKLLAGLAFALGLSGCALPAISAEGAKVKVVSKSPCPAIGNLMTVRLDDDRALNYQSFKKQMEEYNSNQVRDRAGRMGGNQVVEVYLSADKPTKTIVAFYSVHSCGH
jgi:hypothetical protein